MACPRVSQRPGVPTAPCNAENGRSEHNAMGQLGCNGHTKAGFDYLKPDGFRLYLLPPPPAFVSWICCCPLGSGLSPPSALLPAATRHEYMMTCFGLDVQETQNTAQAEEESREIAQITNKIHLDQITHLELPSIARLLCVAARYFLFLRAR